MQFVPLMNDTKWDEIRLAMYAIRPGLRWRTRDVKTGFESKWDTEWFYHFRVGGYDTIQWLDIETPTEGQRVAALRALKKIHVPGKLTESAIRVFGYSRPGEPMEYL